MTCTTKLVTPNPKTFGPKPNPKPQTSLGQCCMLDSLTLRSTASSYRSISRPSVWCLVPIVL